MYENSHSRGEENMALFSTDIVPVVFTGIPVNHYHSFMDQLIGYGRNFVCSPAKHSK